MVERQSLIRRYLWYEHERASAEPSPTPEDNQMFAHFQAHLTRTGTTGRVLPGVGILHATLLQCFRDRKRGGRNTTVTAAERQLAVVQHGSLLQFRGRPYETPVGCTTKEAKGKAREDIQEAALISAATHRVRRCGRQAARRR